MCSFIVVCVVVALIVAFGPKATSSSRLNPCKTCKWFINGIEPKCGFYKTSYDVLGKKLVVHEYAEHVRKNEHMCGEEGYMHDSTYEIPSTTLQKSLQQILEILPLRVQISSQPLEENLTVPVMPFTFAYALLWPLNLPLAVLTGLVEFLEDDAAILRGF